MSTRASTWLVRRKWILAAVGLPVLIALWWGFRPEKLWINQKVNEPAPFVASGDPRPILTGRFEDQAHQTTGRATVYKKPGGEEYLRLSDFTTANTADVYILLAQSIERSHPDGIDLGALKRDQGDQNYDLPAATDLNKYHAAVIYSERSRAVFGVAKLEAF